jgi:hypothetical protein
MAAGKARNCRIERAPEHRLGRAEPGLGKPQRARNRLVRLGQRPCPGAGITPRPGGGQDIEKQRIAARMERARLRRGDRQGRGRIAIDRCAKAGAAIALRIERLRLLRTNRACPTAMARTAATAPVSLFRRRSFTFHPHPWPMVQL